MQHAPTRAKAISGTLGVVGALYSVMLALRLPFWEFGTLSKLGFAQPASRRTARHSE